MSTTNVNYKDLRRKLDARYFVRWVTEFDSNNHILRLVGYCVRDQGDSHWKTVFQHKDYGVCEKVCDMLNENEEELTNVRGT